MTAARRALKNPKGGLTKAGREWFAKKQGAHLQAGVKKSNTAMTPDDMRRKGSWAVRFYGRKGTLPPLHTPGGEPTRFALTAAAWGEPVPKTVAAAKQIAAKGRKLLAAYAKATIKGEATSQAKSTAIPKARRKASAKGIPKAKRTVKVKGTAKAKGPAKEKGPAAKTKRV